MDATLPFINAVPINDIVLLSPSFIICTIQTYLKVSVVLYSSRTDYSYSYSDTLFPIPSNFVFPLSKQIVSDINHFFRSSLSTYIAQ